MTISKLWKYKGSRIRPRHKNNVVKTGALISVPVFLLLMILFWKDHLWSLYEKGIENTFQHFTFNVPLIVTSLLVSIIVPIALILVWYFIFHQSYKKIYHRQKIARMIFSNKFYESKSVRSKITEKTVQKISYFPRFYYRVKDNHIIIKIAMDMSRFQQRFMELGREFENGLFCDLVSTDMEDGFFTYKLLYDAGRNRIGINEALVEKGSMTLMKHIKWGFDKLPHMLISGGTGGGKTYFILTLVKSLVASGADVRILDPKNADLADLEEVLEGKVFSRKNGIMMTLRKSVEDMMRRMDEMKNHPNYKTGENYSYLGYKPVFIIFDEYVAFMDMLDFKERETAMQDIKQIIMLGRQMGFFLVAGAQRPDAKYFADGIRDQFNFRVSLGKMSETGYAMLFGDTDKKFVEKDIKGRGYAYAGTGNIMEFYSPLIPNGYDFIEEIRLAKGA
ncbi:ATP-binding protein [Bacillus safensis]|uniref:FtsK/SpoIIIE domain-containing protein n=1 Tax=Bacillus safensis TaxID=561879 RepID=UPI0022819730|nr:FtsK/SpoIIIE domain-containing protein [Bacillus safensis]MCY7735066.1 ATP-binding protein [Bacillus safensis]MEC1113681.1 FtsK/SpoIIIE domain-containing protein [Bacillus safensis]